MYRVLHAHLRVDDAKVHAGAIFRSAAAHHDGRHHSVVLTSYGTSTFVHEQYQIAFIIQRKVWINELTASKGYLRAVKQQQKASGLLLS